MNVYITYDRYERDEWYSLYGIETNKTRAIKKFKQKHLPDFLQYGPDDCHSFQLQKVNLSKAGYNMLFEIHQHGSDKDVKNFLMPIFHEEEEYEVETICSTDGCSDNWEIVKFYCEQIGIDVDDDEAMEEAQEKLLNDDELYEKILKKYIAINY